MHSQWLGNSHPIDIYVITYRSALTHPLSYDVYE